MEYIHLFIHLNYSGDTSYKLHACLHTYYHIIYRYTHIYKYILTYA